jgi:hypothetical protein
MRGKIFMSIFALPFFGVGVWMLWSVGNVFVDAFQMQDWVQVEARLLSGGYTSHRGDDSYTYEAYARYTYDVQGQTFVADRVGLSGGADNIGNYQQEIGNNLSRAHASGESILVYVDPNDPSQAIIDRGIRWGMVGFKSIFLFVFGGVGLGLLVFTWRAPKEKDTSDPRYADSPWLLNDNWQTPTIRSSSKASMYAMWAFAVVWNLINAYLPFVMYDEVVNKENYLALVALLFTAVGIGLIVWAIRRTLEWRRFGASPVTLDPFPGSIGGHVGGTIDLAMPHDHAHEYQLTLTNIKSYISGSGKNRSRNEKAEWQDMIVAHAESTGSGARLTFRFDVPEGLRESDADRDDTYYIWRLNLSAELDGTDLDRSFDIPVYATATQSRSLSRLAVERSTGKQTAMADKAVLNIVKLIHDAGGRRMKYPIGRNLGAALIGFVVGSVFAAIGGFLIFGEGERLFGAIFGGIGALVAVGTLYSMANSLEVSRDTNGIKTVRRVFGIPVKRSQMGSHEFVMFDKDSRYQSNGGGKHVMHYSIYAVDRQGDKVVVGEGFKGDSQAEAAIRLIGEVLGLRSAPDPRSTEESPRPHQATVSHYLADTSR